MWLHDAAQRGKLPTFRELGSYGYNPYRYGHAFWAYIAGRWGDPVIPEIFKVAGATGDPGIAIASVLEISPDELMKDWETSVIDAYQAVLEKTEGPEVYGRVLISPQTGSGNLNIAPAMSPDGSQVAFISEKDLFSIEIFVANGQTGEVERKIIKVASDPHLESLQFINSAGAWSPDGTEFVLAGIRKGTPILTFIDPARGRKIKEHKVKEVGEIFNPTWSPDGRYVAFTASVGGLMDLFVVEVETGELRRLTDDAYAEYHPAWSPDGRYIAVATDHYTSDLDNLEWGDYRLALVDARTGEVESVRGTPEGKNINPQWAPDATNIYFLSDANGISNIYRINIRSGDLDQITNLTTGVSGITQISPAISMSADGKSLAFSAYEGNRYTIYKIEDEEVLNGGPVLPPLSDVSPAVLPPADRPVGDVLALLDNPSLGLPTTADEFETAGYSAGLSLDYIAPPNVAVGSDRFGTYVGGGTALFWSDMLGRHTLTTLLQVNGSFQDIAALVGYENRARRWNWSTTVSQFPYVTRFFQIGVSPEGDFLEQEIRLRQINRDISLYLSYPLSRVQRVEFSVGYSNISFDNETVTRSFSSLTGQQLDSRQVNIPSCKVDPTNPFCTPSALNLGTTSLAMVYDNTFFGYTGPVLGQRYRLEVAPSIGSIDMVAVAVDYRRYFMPVRPFTLAGRLLHFGRYASGGEDPRLLPMFTGYQQLLRGYSSGSFESRECLLPAESSSFVGSSSCPVYDQLFGSRMAVSNFELRMPFPQAFGVRRLPGFPPLTLALFFDAGVAWWSQGTAFRIGANQDPFGSAEDFFGSLVSSYGAALRVNFFGALLMEIDYVHPNSRPLKGWHWQFGFTPGF
jgi:Tol biopolymer transport system component